MGNGDRIGTGDEGVVVSVTLQVTSSFHHARTEPIKLKHPNLQSNLKQLKKFKQLYIILVLDPSNSGICYSGIPRPALGFWLELLTGCTN